MAKLYELSFWARKEADPEKLEEELIKLLENLGLEIVKKISLKMRNMAYPILKENIGYWGTIYFNATPEKIPFIDKEVKSKSLILRYVILHRKQAKFLKETKEQSQNKTNNNEEKEKIKLAADAKEANK